LNKPARNLSDAERQSLLKAADLLGVPILDEQMQELAAYLNALWHYNEHTNLVSDASTDVVIRDHLIDALTLVPIISRQPGNRALIDIGSGAGFPGFVLAIMLPQIKVTLLDSIGKKTRFLAETAEALGFGAESPRQIAVITGRAEEQGHIACLRERFDFATARAVGQLDLVAELGIPFLKLGGKLLASKSRKQSTEEMAVAEDFIKKLGGSSVVMEAPNPVATGKDLVILISTKMTPTPARYPRPMSQIKRGSKRGPL
jgi:16S rRNA (guanine(527)-N(7))-methyltransferase RsmG